MASGHGRVEVHLPLILSSAKNEQAMLDRREWESISIVRDIKAAHSSKCASRLAPAQIEGKGTLRCQVAGGLRDELVETAHASGGDPVIAAGRHAGKVRQPCGDHLAVRAAQCRDQDL